MAARRMRPDRVSRYFARFRLGFAWLVPRSITSTAPAMRIFPDLAGSKKLLSAPVHHRTSRDRRLTTAAEAFVGVRPALQRCRASLTTGGANKTLRPASLKQK